MPQSRRRVHYEHEMEQAAGDVLGDMMAEAAWPGVFADGKQITETRHEKGWKDTDFDVLQFRLSDGSEMNVVGKFEVRYKPKTVEGKTGDLVKHGSNLMSGQLELEEGE